MLRNAYGRNIGKWCNSNRMKKHRIILLLAMMVCYVQVFTQVYYTKSGEIRLYSETPLEKIDPLNDKTVSVLDLERGTVSFSALIKGFTFRNALMQTHFNENYLESDKYPKAVFKAQGVDFSELILDEDGSYDVPISGTLTIRTIEKEIETIATFDIKNQVVSAAASFEVTPQEFNIEIPGLVRDKIAKTIRVEVQVLYEPYTK